MAKTDKSRKWVIILGSVLGLLVLGIIAFIVLVVLVGKNNEPAEQAVTHMNRAVSHFNGAGGPQGLPSVENINGARAELAIAKDNLARFQAGSLTTDEDKRIASALAAEMGALEHLMNVSQKIIADGVAYDSEITEYQQAHANYNAASTARNQAVEAAGY